MASIFSRLWSYLKNIAAEVMKNFNSWLAKSILALITAVALLLITPIKDNYLSPLYYRLTAYFSSIDEIAPAEALRIAKRHVGQNAVFAIPFHNAGDPNQFIAVWAKPKGEGCDFELEPDTCPTGSGALSAFLLIGKGGTFSVTDTKVPALPSHMDGISAEGGSSIFWHHAGLTDWNNDGKFEMLSIADQSAMTAPRHLIFISLYETNSNKLSQLRVTTPPDSSELVGEHDAKLRSWLIDRYTEYASQSFEGCARARTGILTCNPVSDEEIAEDPNSAFFFGLLDEWIELNGNDFTTGQLKLSFKPSPADMSSLQSLCEVGDDTIRLHSAFKGPLFIENTGKNEIAVLYKQDDGHHREIPALILGKKYIWMGLRDKDGLLAIDRGSMEVKSIRVKDYSKLFGTIEDEQKDEAYYPAKDRQIENLTVSDKKLKVGDSTIKFDQSDLTFDAANEFAAAPSCNIWQ